LLAHVETKSVAISHSAAAGVELDPSEPMRSTRLSSTNDECLRRWGIGTRAWPLRMRGRRQWNRRGTDLRPSSAVSIPAAMRADAWAFWQRLVGKEAQSKIWSAATSNSLSAARRKRPGPHFYGLFFVGH